MMKWADGKKTILAGVGLLCLSVYQLTTGEYDKAAETFFAALGLLGIRHAVKKSAEAAK